MIELKGKYGKDCKGAVCGVRIPCPFAVFLYMPDVNFLQY